MPLSDLCVGCGLCCDGNLFSWLPLRPSEVATMQRLALPVVTRADGTPGIEQRCTALEGRCCTVYAERPEACRRYRCYLLMAAEEGEVSLEEAQAVVDEAHARIRAVETALPADTKERRNQAESYLDRHFRGRHRRT